MERLALDRWASPWLRHQHLARYEWAAGFVKGCRVLDAACGTAYGCEILKAGGALGVDGVDYARGAFRPARRRGADPDPRFLVADVTRLPLKDGAYDVCVSFETIEHVPDRGFLSEVCRILKPGGTFLCSTPNRDLLSPGHSLDDRPANPFHLREYDREELDSLLRSFFSSVSLLGQTLFSRRHGSLLKRAGRVSPTLALRLHQLRNILGLPWEARERHAAQPFPLEGEPEVLVAVCTK